MCMVYQNFLWTKLSWALFEISYTVFFYEKYACEKNILVEASAIWKQNQNPLFGCHEIQMQSVKREK